MSSMQQALFKSNAERAVEEELQLLALSSASWSSTNWQSTKKVACVCAHSSITVKGYIHRFIVNYHLCPDNNHMVVSSKFAFNWNQHGKFISKSAVDERFKHWKNLMFSFLWSESWTFCVETTGTSDLNLFLNLVLKLPWAHLTHSMTSWGWTN